MRFWLVSLLSLFVVSFVLEEGSVDGLPFNAIVPNHSTGWFHKPGPTESLFFGLIVLKVLALRMAGVFPYNLNKLLEEGSYIDNQLKSWKKKSSRKGRAILEPSSEENQIIQRVLLGLRRIDSHDCFIKHLCTMNQRKISANETTPYENQIISIFTGGKSGEIGGLYEGALQPHPDDCEKKYPLCPLNKQDFSVSSILNGFF